MSIIRRSIRRSLRGAQRESDEKVPLDNSTNNEPTQDLKDYGDIQFPRVFINEDVQRLQELTLVWTLTDIKQFKHCSHFLLRSRQFGGPELELHPEAKFHLIFLGHTEFFSFCIDYSNKDPGAPIPRIGGTCRILDRSRKEFISTQIVPKLNSNPDWNGCENIISRKALFRKDFLQRYEILNKDKELVLEATVVFADSRFSRQCVLPPADRIRLRENLPNFTLISSDGRSFKVNHQKLKSASGFFLRNLSDLSSKPERNSYKMVDVPENVLEIVVEYLHGDLLEIPSYLTPRIIQWVLTVQEVARSYEFNILRSFCRPYLESMEITLENAADLLIYADKNKLSREWLETVAGFIREHLDKVTRMKGTEKIKNYSWDLLSNYVLSVPSTQL